MICKYLLPSVIKWPNSEPRNAEIEHGFRSLKGFPGVIGAIDSSHIPIRTPKEHSESYINRKGFPSIILQAVCDSNLNFTDVYCGWPGSVHDARVLKNSPLFLETETDQNKKFPGNTHLIGDSAYGLSSWLVVPFKDYGNLNEKSRRFNYIHSSTRMCIERAFGALKGRFRRLKYVDLLEIDKIVNMILRCCALHQLCLYNLEDVKEYLREGLELNEEVNNYQDFMPSCKSAEIKRDHIKELLDK
ncbi:putative nuclease HARBI1 [Mya arenaria]|uniref:putative nuclease HARBI1 n=1 Tax=Mya arenaria TaxID=6604 RepID=UPI0022E65250|nr:putative nuclease HARBI1 [Mya arenaria]